MYLSLCPVAQRIAAGSWAGWSRVAGIALLGLGGFLQPVVVQADPLPAPSWVYCYSATSGPGACWSSYPSFTSWQALHDDMVSRCTTAYSGSVVSETTVNADPQFVEALCDSTIQSDVYFRMQAKPTCQSGWSYAGNNQCVNRVCSSEGGSVRPFNVVINDDGACNSSLAPQYVCLANGCRAVVQSGGRDCVGLPNATPPSSMWSGFAQSVTSEQCSSSDKVVGITSASTVAPSGGGAGVSSVTSSMDSVNLSRIATNTFKMAQGLAGSGGSSGSGCGGASQPPCAIAEGDTEGKGVAASGLQAGDQSSMEAALGGQASQLSLSQLPTFDQGSRWSLSFLPFLEASGPLDCKVEWQSMLAGGQVTAGYNFCGFADYVRQFLYWVFGLFTAVGVWMMIYGGRD